jgi:rare lipoprotein A (peptidoglycan hydrolase)
MKRVVDLTYAAAQKLDFIAKGLTKVKVEVLKKTQKTK